MLQYSAKEFEGGSDFEPVHIHTDHRAAETAQTINASAFTVGNNVVGAGQYTQKLNTVKHLIAHDLAHTIQQRNQYLADRLWHLIEM